ncbi:MAG: sigma-54-dependent Fis family transcriptional regulator [bacterium]|nr:sigma-54-dependent Fis family transcriptional regulator [bacterium]
MRNKTVLLVDDDEKALFLVSDALEGKEFQVKTTTLPSQALEIIQSESVDAVVLDLVMPGIDGIETLQTIKKISPHIPVIMLSGHGTIEKAVTSLKLGAYDFLEKPVSSDKIAVTLRNALNLADLEQDKSNLLEKVREEYRMIGNSNTMTRISRMMEKIAPTDSPVLITGGSGTGKELIARALHLKSPRAAKPFVALNCAAIPEELMESELFGNEKGAFTSAGSSKPGLFEQAHKGTLFLDEISEMSCKLQPKFLRALETMENRRVGGTTVKKVDVRILAATNKDLQQCIREKTFREDLYYRVAVLTIDAPPLRERQEDIPLLLEHFSQQFCSRRKILPITFHPRTVELLMAHSWPGNIRQLKNMVEKIVVLSDHNEILPKDIQSYLTPAGETVQDLSHQAGETLEQTRKRVEREKLLVKLHAMDWNYEKTAGALGISRATLFNKLKAYGISGKRNR